MACGRHDVGDVRRPGDRSRRAGRRRGSRGGRARMRDGVLLRLACASWCATSRRRRDACAAGHGAQAPGRDRGLVPAVEANAEEVPLPDASFDLALSEYGASIWCDPYRWIPEAHRLLRPGGRLVFLCNSPLVMLCAVEDEDATSSGFCGHSGACTDRLADGERRVPASAWRYVPLSSATQASRSRPDRALCAGWRRRRTSTTPS